MFNNAFVDIFSFFRALPPTKPDVAINLIPSFEEKVFAATSLLLDHINFKSQGMTYLLSLSQWHDYYWRSIEVVLKRYISIDKIFNNINKNNNINLISNAKGYFV